MRLLVAGLLVAAVIVYFSPRRHPGYHPLITLRRHPPG